MKTSTPQVLTTFAFVCFALVQNTRAVSPAPDGGYPGFNTAEGTGALQSLTTGTRNTANGNSALYHNTTSTANTANGTAALLSNTTGTRNTATGDSALYHNTTASSNTANGVSALASNTTGTRNTATGDSALYHNTTSSSNTANGTSALFTNTTGTRNTATGDGALYGNTIGHSNTANGVVALKHNTSGNSNTANGDSTLYNNTTGTGNTADGDGALFSNTTGHDNIGLGAGAGQNLTTGSNNIDIDNSGVAGESNAIRIGTQGIQTKAFIAGIGGVPVTGTAVVVNSSGQLGVAASSSRFKDQVKPMNQASEAILALKPVTFRYKRNLDPKGTPQFGLIAEEVAAVNPDLTVRDENGEIYTVRYDAVNAMLLNEFLKEHRKVQELEARLAQQEKDFTARLNEQDAKIQKVSDKIELSKPAPRTVGNN